MLTNEIEHNNFPFPFNYFEPSIRVKIFSAAWTANPLSYALSSPFNVYFFPLSGPPKIKSVEELPVTKLFTFGESI